MSGAAHSTLAVRVPHHRHREYLVIGLPDAGGVKRISIKMNYKLMRAIINYFSTRITPA